MQNKVFSRHGRSPNYNLFTTDTFIVGVTTFEGSNTSVVASLQYRSTSQLKQFSVLSM